jgi:pyruvate formate lyase activating enzyme
MPRDSQKNRDGDSFYESFFTKRDFLKLCGKGFCLMCARRLFGFPAISGAQTAKKGLIGTKLSPYFQRLDGDTIQCELCPRRCRVPDGERGLCRVRENRGGQYYSLAYGNPCIFYLDPVEKELIFHVLPGSTSLTLSTAGCNFHCKFCENWEISQAFPEDIYSYEISPDLVVKKAREMGARSITYTYGEPTVFYEYMSDIAHHAKRAGLLNLIHSNGFINKRPLMDLCHVLDAAQIDLKGFSETFYRELSGGELAPVLETLKTLNDNEVHLEITNLIIPTKNDDLSMIQKMCRWIKNELGPKTPVHFSRFYPLHKLQHLPPTPVSTLEKARSMALESGLEYVYIGNVPGHKAWNTYCPNCRRIIIRRTGYMIREMHLEKGKCAYCGEQIPGIWS